MTAKKRFVTERSRPAKCPADAVIDLLLDVSNRPGWQPEVVSAEGPHRLATGDSVWGQARMLGFGVEGRSVATIVSPTLYEEQVIVGVGMTVRYEVRPHDDGCLVVHHLESHLPTGFSGRILSLLLRSRLKRMQKTALERLVAQSEAGSIS